LGDDGRRTAAHGAMVPLHPGDITLRCGMAGAKGTQTSDTKGRDGQRWGRKGTQK